MASQSDAVSLTTAHSIDIALGDEIGNCNVRSELVWMCKTFLSEQGLFDINMITSQGGGPSGLWLARWDPSVRLPGRKERAHTGGNHPTERLNFTLVSQ